MRSRVTRALTDLDYYQASPLGWKHGTIIVWAGMRGVVTLAAAQTLPRETPGRALLVFVAFLVAVGSLMLQGFTLPWLVRAAEASRAPADAGPSVDGAAAASTTSCAMAAASSLTAGSARAPGRHRRSPPSCSRSSGPG